MIYDGGLRGHYIEQNDSWLLNITLNQIARICAYPFASQLHCVCTGMYLPISM